MATTGFWGFTESIMLSSLTLEWVLVWGIISYVAGVVIPFCFLHFTYYFPYQEKRFNFPARAGVTFALLLAVVIVAIPSGLVKSAVIRPTHGDLILNSSGWTVWFTIFIILFVWSYFNLFQKLRKSSGFFRQQLTRVITFTIIPVIIAMFFDVLMPFFYGEALGWVGVQSLLVLALGVFYYLTLFGRKIYLGNH